MKVSVSKIGSMTITAEESQGQQYNLPSGPRQIPLYLVSPSPTPSRKYIGSSPAGGSGLITRIRGALQGKQYILPLGAMHMPMYFRPPARRSGWRKRLQW